MPLAFTLYLPLSELAIQLFKDLLRVVRAVHKHRFFIWILCRSWQHSEHDAWSWCTCSVDFFHPGLYVPHGKITHLWHIIWTMLMCIIVKDGGVINALLPQFFPETFPTLECPLPGTPPRWVCLFLGVLFSILRTVPLSYWVTF